MKKLLSTLLVASMILCLVPAFAAFAAEGTDILSQPRYELEDATLLKDDIRDGDDATVSGGKFVGGFDYGAQTATFTVNAPQAGAYKLTVGFITMDGGRQFDVTVNGKMISNITCGASGGSWSGDVKTVSVVVSLSAGENTVVLGQDDGFGPSMDYIEFAELTDATALVAGEAVKIEAENAYVLSGVKVSDSEVASGGKLVNDIGGDSGNAGRYLEFIVDAPAAGEATIVIYYFCAMERNIEMSVNGGDATVITVANNGTWGNPGDSASTAHDAVVVNLEEGVNSIKLYNSTGWGPNLDFVEITAAEEEEPEPTPTPDPDPEPTPTPDPDPEPTPTPDPDPDPVKPAPTGDAMLAVSAFALAAVAGTVLITRKRKNEE